MRTYLFRRLIHTLLALFLMLVVVFIFTQTIGDPVGLMLPEAPPEAVQALREKMGLNDPLHIQFGRYLAGLMRLDFGTSLWQGVPNLQLILSRLPATFILGITAITLAAGIGIVLGGLAALRPGSMLDRIVIVMSTIAVTSVDFWVALMLITLISVNLGWLPTSGYGDVKNLVLPAVVAAFRPMGRITQVTRPAIMEALAKEYILVARGKGLRERTVLLTHAGRNAAIVLVTLVGYEFANVVSGSVIIETVFAWPGVGFLLVQAISRRDWTLIVAATLVVGFIVITINLLIDLLYVVLDPRIRYE
ncbi:MAG TPA: ABC transporter permease [Candidatus Limnocylindria bacterium]|jgi:peptide/nickel transport system permease protein|nr:ABC transporter permease [Candidatus Limnocylindria bacterium]